jgi:iron complex outermembrane recepter protein
LKGSLLIIAICFLSIGGRIPIHAQSCELTFSGKLMDEEGMPVSGATLFLKQVGKGVISAQDGSFRFENLCKGKYSLEIKFLGFETIRQTINPEKSMQLDFSLIPDEKLLQEVEVKDKLENVSAVQNYSSLSGKQLEETQGKSLGESLKEMTGVNSIQTGPAIFKPVIHGVHSQRILILNNGIRQEGQSWGAEHAPEIDPFIASNIVVVKDAAAIKYGTDALGGVVIVNPAELPTEAGIGGQLHLVGAGNGRSGVVSGLLEGGSKRIKGFGWRVQGTGKKSGDFHAAKYTLTNTGFEELNFSTSLGYHKEDRGIEFFYSHFNTTIGILRGSAVSSTEDLALAFEREPPQYTEDFSYSINQPKQKVTHDLLKLNGHLEKGKNLYHFQYGLQINKRREFDFRRGSLKDIPALGYLLYTHTIDLEWERQKTDKASRCFGFNGMIQDNNKIDGTQTLPFIPNFINYSSGLYLVEKVKKNKWDLEAGLRYDFRFYDVVGFDFRNQLYKAKLNFNNFSATAGATYAMSKYASFSSSIGSTWRPPNVAELYSLGTHQSAAAIEFGLLLDEITNEIKPITSSNFKTEQALKWVSGYHYTSQKINFEVSGYINYIANYIYLRPRGVTQNIRGIFPYFRYTQTNASFLGIDFSGEYQLTKQVKLNSKISLLRATDETNNDFLVFIPSNRYEISLRHDQIKIGKATNFYAEAKVKYIARQSRAPRVVSITEINDANASGEDIFVNDPRNFDFVAAPDGYLVFGASTGVSFPFKKSKLNFRLSTDNLLNTAYREYTNRLRYYADDLGRNITLAINFSF